MYTEYTVNTGPCRLQPYINSGTLSATRNIDSVMYSGVTCDSSIDVPEMPLSYSFTGARNIVIPIALIMPAAVNIRKFFILSSDISFFIAPPFHGYSGILKYSHVFNAVGISRLVGKSLHETKYSFAKYSLSISFVILSGLGEGVPSRLTFAPPPSP